MTTISSLGGSCYFPSDTKNIDREAAGMEEVCEDTVCIQFLWTFRTSVVGSQLTQRLRGASWAGDVRMGIGIAVMLAETLRGNYILQGRVRRASRVG